MKKIYAGLTVIVAAVALSSCAATPADQLTDLRSAIDAGKECPELFPLLKAIPADRPAAENAQAEMRNIGCFSKSSERTDAERSAIDPDSEWIGVPGGQLVEVSDECLDVSREASNTVDVDAAELLIEQSLGVCQSANEWLSALTQYPGMMGMVDGYIPSATDLQTACTFYKDTTVCNDVAKLGI